MHEIEIEIVREEEIRQILDKLNGDSRDLHAIATLALSTGMRRGELLAIRWQDVDLEVGQVRVERSLEQLDAGYHSKPRRADTDAARYRFQHRL